MNEFDNNYNGNGADASMTPPNTQNTQNSNSTYSNVYTPEADGYVRTEGIESPYSYGPESGGSSDNGNGSFYTPPYTPPKKKKNSGSKIAIALVATVGILTVLFGVAFMGFTVAKVFTFNDEIINSEISTGDLEQGNKADDSQIALTPDSVSPDNSNSPAGAEVPDASKHTETIVKNSGSELNEGKGTIGTLMTKSQAVALIKDSVVEITTEQVVKGNSFMQYVQSGAGSGVIISEKGYVITNNHVISGTSKIIVRLTNGNEYEATLIGTDAGSDIAVLKITPNEELTVATLGSSSKLSMAEEILVIGNPLGELGGTVTNGIVSALAREITIDGENMTLIQTNAAVNPGNSGGGMFNLYGELVGIVNAKSSGEDVEGLGFAIPIDTAYDVVLQLMDYGYVRGRVDHGLELIDINDLFTAASYRVGALGVYVYESKFTDEIKNGDRIASINGKEVSSSAGVKEALYGCKVGDTVSVTVVRGGRFVDVKLTLREYVPENAGSVSFE